MNPSTVLLCPDGLFFIVGQSIFHPLVLRLLPPSGAGRASTTRVHIEPDCFSILIAALGKSGPVARQLIEINPHWHASSAKANPGGGGTGCTFKSKS